MGCDIHPAIEVRQFPSSDTDYWEFVAIPPHWRNYEFFTLLAGVRGDSEYDFSEPKGLPEHLNERTVELLDGDHTPSWFSLRELHHIEAKLSTTASGVPDGTYRLLQIWVDLMLLYRRAYSSSASELSADDVRVVFNFDN